MTIVHPDKGELTHFITKQSINSLFWQGREARERGVGGRKCSVVKRGSIGDLDLPCSSSVCNVLSWMEKLTYLMADKFNHVHRGAVFDNLFLKPYSYPCRMTKGRKHATHI